MKDVKKNLEVLKVIVINPSLISNSEDEKVYYQNVEKQRERLLSNMSTIIEARTDESVEREDMNHVHYIHFNYCENHDMIIFVEFYYSDSSNDDSVVHIELKGKEFNSYSAFIDYFRSLVDDILSHE